MLRLTMVLQDGTMHIIGASTLKQALAELQELVEVVQPELPVRIVMEKIIE